MKAKIGLLGFIFSVFFIGCSKDDQTDTPMSEDDLTINANIDEMSEDISKVAQDTYFKVVSGTGKNANGVAAFLPECAQVVNSESGDNWVRTIDFGSGCELKNGNILKGKIIVTGSKNFGSLPYTISCTFENFRHNVYSIKGSKTLVRTMESTPNLETAHPVLTMNVNFKVTALNGVIRNITGTRVRELIEGLDTPESWTDDVFLISGKQSVTSPKGIISTTISSPLRVEMNCNHVVQGVLVHTKNSKTATLDYGDGNCDDKATIIVSGIEKEIKLGM